MKHRGAISGGLDWIGWKPPGGVKYKAPYGANKAIFTQAYSLTKVYCLMLTV